MSDISFKAHFICIFSFSGEKIRCIAVCRQIKYWKYISFLNLYPTTFLLITLSQTDEDLMDCGLGQFEGSRCSGWDNDLDIPQAAKWLKIAAELPQLRLLLLLHGRVASSRECVFLSALLAMCVYNCVFVCVRVETCVSEGVRMFSQQNPDLEKVFAKNHF